MKPLLTLTAVLEGATGLGLLLMPAAMVPLLLGAPLDGPAALIVSRVGGAALLALGVACWLSRSDGGPALVRAMLLYNVAAAAILAHAAIGLSLSGIGLWPTISLHTALAVWCILVLKYFHFNQTTTNP